MEKLVVTLLVQREESRNGVYPYAVQIGSIDPRTQERHTTVRLIHKNGTRATWRVTRTYYCPKEWRAATRTEQSQCAALMHGNPRPWYGGWSGYKSVYEFPGAGDEDTNNGQLAWPEIEHLDRAWEAEREIREKFMSERKAREQAERNRRIARWGDDL
jgi:hypothetical protein